MLPCWCADQKIVNLCCCVYLWKKTWCMVFRQVMVDLLVVITGNSSGILVDYEENSGLIANSHLVFHGETVPHSHCIAPVPAGNTTAFLLVLSTLWLTIGESLSHLTLSV